MLAHGTEPLPLQNTKDDIWSSDCPESLPKTSKNYVVKYYRHYSKIPTFILVEPSKITLTCVFALLSVSVFGATLRFLHSYREGVEDGGVDGYVRILVA